MNVPTVGITEDDCAAIRSAKAGVDKAEQLVREDAKSKSDLEDEQRLLGEQVEKQIEMGNADNPKDVQRLVELEARLKLFPKKLRSADQKIAESTAAHNKAVSNLRAVLLVLLERQEKHYSDEWVAVMESRNDKRDPRVKQLLIDLYRFAPEISAIHWAAEAYKIAPNNSNMHRELAQQLLDGSIRFPSVPERFMQTISCVG